MSVLEAETASGPISGVDRAERLSLPMKLCVRSLGECDK